MSAKKSEFELDERAAEAKFILNNPIFLEAVDNLREKHLQIMMATKVGSPESIQSHAMLKVFEELVSELQSAITDQKMIKQRRPNYG
jgi:hypothetical protein